MANQFDEQLQNTEYVAMDKFLISEIPMTLRKCYMMDMNISLDNLLQKQRNERVFQNIQDLFEYFDPLIKDLHNHLKELYS